MQVGSRQIAAVLNVTPLIDVLLVLLIVFVLLPTHTHGLKSQLPQTDSTQAAAPNPQQAVLHIASDGSLQIDSRPVLRAELGARLQGLFAGRPDGVLFVDGSSEPDFADGASAIGTARGAGVERIGILTGHEPLSVLPDEERAKNDVRYATMIMNRYDSAK